MVNDKDLPDPARLVSDYVSNWAANLEADYGKRLGKKSRFHWHGDGPPPENWLGSPINVGRLVGCFVIRCIERHPDMNPKSLDAEDAKEARRLGEIFVGQSSEYVPVKGWNEPGKIDRFISSQIKGGHFKPEGTVSEVFKFTVEHVFQFAALSNTGAEVPEKFITMGLGFATGWLLGIYDAPATD